MKEWRIPEKVTSIMGRLTGKKTIERMERDREIASIANLITQEIDVICEENKRNITRLVHVVLRDRLK